MLQWQRVEQLGPVPSREQRKREREQQNERGGTLLEGKEKECSWLVCVHS